MARVPVVTEAPVSPPRATRGLGPTIAASATRVGSEVAELAIRQLEADFTRQFHSEQVELERIANDLRLEAQEDPDPLNATTTFESRFTEAAQERLAGVENPRVREELEAVLPRIFEPKRVAVASLSQQRYQKLLRDTFTTKVIPGHVEAAISAENDVELDLSVNALRDAVVSSPAHTEAEKSELLRAAETNIQGGRIQRMIFNAMEVSGDDGLALLDSVGEILRDDNQVGLLSDGQKTELLDAADGVRSDILQAQFRGRRLEFFDEVNTSQTLDELDILMEQRDALFASGAVTEPQAIQMTGWLESRRSEIIKENAGAALVAQARAGRVMDHDNPDHRRAVNAAFEQEVIPIMSEDAEAGIEEGLLLVEDTQVIPEQWIGSLKGTSQDDPETMAAGARQWHQLQEAAPSAAADQMTGVEFDDLSLMHMLMENNVPAPEAHAQIRALRTTDPDTLKMIDDRLEDIRAEESDLDWLEDQRGRFELERQWAFDRDFDGEFPEAFVAPFSNLVRLKYVARVNQNTGDPRPIEWAREQAMRQMLGVKWGQTGVGARNKSLVFVPPEKVHPESSSEAITEQLVQDVLQDTVIGLGGSVLEPSMSPAFEVRLPEGEMGAAVLEPLQELVNVRGQLTSALAQAAEDDPNRPAAEARIAEIDAQIRDVAPGVDIVEIEQAQREVPDVEVTGGFLGIGTNLRRLFPGSLEEERREELIEKWGPRIFLQADLDTVTMVDENGQPVFSWAVFLLDENGENPQQLYGRDGLPYRWEHDWESTRQARESKEREDKIIEFEHRVRRGLKALAQSAFPPTSREELNRRVARARGKVLGTQARTLEVPEE